MTDPGLDPRALAGMLHGPARRAAAATEQVREHFAAHGPGFVAWSGGKDSTAALRIALETDPSLPVCFYDSGLEFPENLAYIHGLAEAWSVALHVIKARPGALEAMAATGAWDHGAAAPADDPPDLHEALVGGPSRAAHAAHGQAQVWGLRAAESASRRALLAPGRGTVRRADGTAALSPVWNWRDEDVNAFLASRGIPENPVYARLRALGATGRDLRVGLVLDGRGLEHGRAVWVRRGWPDLWADIVRALPRMREWA